MQAEGTAAVGDHRAAGTPGEPAHWPIRPMLPTAWMRGPQKKFPGGCPGFFSQDPGSASRGGELDWAYPGDLVPEFERAMVALQPGQVSDPVRSVFGVHLIQLLERKREPLTEQRLRTAARMVLRDQKLAEAVADWTREVRANAYVEIKRDDL